MLGIILFQYFSICQSFNLLLKYSSKHYADLLSRKLELDSSLYDSGGFSPVVVTLALGKDVLILIRFLYLLQGLVIGLYRVLLAFQC